MARSNISSSLPGSGRSLFCVCAGFCSLLTTGMLCSTCSMMSSLYCVCVCALMKETVFSISLVEVKQPRTRTGLILPLGRYSMSPCPSSFSAPPVSRMVRESTCERTERAIRLGMFALIRPVMMSVVGRWVAMMRCMPAARAFCARRQMASSTSLEVVIIRSASSSMMTTICGSGSSSLSGWDAMVL